MLRTVLVASAAIALTGGVAATAATAAAPASPRISVHAFGSVARPSDGAASDYLAGYQVSEPGISRATVTFKVPSLDCSDPNGAYGMYEGFGDEQTVGSPTMAAGAIIACIGTSPYYAADAFANGVDSTNSISPGDKLSLIFTQTPRLASIRVKDLTSAVTTSASQTPTPDNSLVFGALPAFYGSAVPMPVPSFGSTTLSYPYLENTTLSGWSPGKINRFTDGNVQEIRTSGFASLGQFKLTYVNP
jgi:hypothetical protein